MPPDLEPVLVVKLEPGWRHDPREGTLRRQEGTAGATEVFDPAPDLPAASRIEAMVPDLARASPESLSEPELELARYLHVFPGRGADLDELLEVIASWSCVEEVRRPPQISLP